MAKRAKTKADDLLAALNFVSVAGTRDDADYKQHVVLNNDFAIMCDGQITAGYPIAESLECCPQLAQIKAALARTGNSLSIAELPNGQLSIAGDKLTAKIPCINFDQLPDSVLTKPDPNIAAIDDRIKFAFYACGVCVSENGLRAVECGLLLEANQCTGTNGKILIQFWHGIDLPPGLFVPAIFAKAIVKCKLALTGFGFTPERSVTLYFENGAWLKTQLYQDKYPDVGAILNKQASPLPLSEGLLEAVETLDAIEPGCFVTMDGKVTIENAEYEIDVAAKCQYASEWLKVILPFAKTIDLSTYDDRAFFFGENLRGVIVGIVPPTKVKTMAEWEARGAPPDEIPF